MITALDSAALIAAGALAGLVGSAGGITSLIGSGVLTLTLLLLLVDQHLPTANALKNMLIGAGSIASATLFALAASVDWRAAVPLAIGMLCGSSLGPRLTRRLPVQPLRVMIALLGIALAIQLFADPNL